ncbi:MAG: hypothetical protein GKR91_14440 [Pseudomonadales bacterium]|nr:hypothetical protein [Pseudomonadales bacterium]
MGYRINCWKNLVGQCLLSFISSAYGAEEDSAPEEVLEVPSLEFLEFLGSFETDEGEWIDPESLMTEDFGNLLDATPIFVPDGQENNTDNADSRQNR